MTDTIAPAAPAGWYDDPSDPENAYRWWSGEAWTEHTSVKVPSVPQQFAPVVTTSADDPAPYGVPESYLAKFSRDPAVNSAGSSIGGSGYGSGSGHVPSYTTGPFASPQTLGVWLIAFLPLMNLLILSAFIALAFAANQAIPPLVPYLVGVGLSWLFAWLDRRSLRDRGYDTPNLLWNLLLPPLIYLIARGRVLRRQGAKAWPPEVGYVASMGVVILFAMIFASVASALLGGPSSQFSGGSYGGGASGEHGLGNGQVVTQQRDAGSIPDESLPWEPQIEHSLAQWGGYDLVDCSMSASLIDKESTFPCVAYSGGAPTQLSVTITSLGNIGFTESTFGTNA